MRPIPRALNKPMLILGVDRKLAGVAFTLAVIVGANGSAIAAAALFTALWVEQHIETRRLARGPERSTPVRSGSSCSGQTC